LQIIKRGTLNEIEYQPYNNVKQDNGKQAAETHLYLLLFIYYKIVNEVQKYKVMQINEN